MRVAVLGADGMLGHKVYQVFREADEAWATVRGGEWAHHPLFRGDRERLRSGVDARHFASVAAVIRDLRPALVVNCIGVVKQVEQAHDAEACIEVNALLPHRLAGVCRETGARLFQISTDCVFSGTRAGGYVEDDVSDADDLYGRSKRLGEVSGTDGVLTIRTSIIGRELRGGHSLLEWFLASRHRTVSGYRRALFSGFPTIVLARTLHALAHGHPDVAGLYHEASEGISKYDLLQRLRAAYGLPVEIVPRDEPVCDRRLTATRFLHDTGLAAASWDELIGALVADSTPYAEWRTEHVAG
jgi:dTDP-4-dehydrorhamnose reductase